MAKEKRMIDANALSEKIGIMKFEITRNHGGYRYCNEEEKNEWDKLDSFDSLVCDAPTVDAVEVVRCGNCKHFREVGGPSGGECAWGNCQKRACVLIYADDFCSYGERRSENAAD